MHLPDRCGVRARAGSALAALAVRSGSFDDPGGTRSTASREGFFNPQSNGKSIGIRVNAEANDNDINIVSAPTYPDLGQRRSRDHQVGDNIPIVTGRTDAATGGDNLSQSVNVERQDVGVTLRVTPQISEGDTLRLDDLPGDHRSLSRHPDRLGDPEEVGVALSNRKIENTVVVNDGETVAIGGLIDETFTETT